MTYLFVSFFFTSLESGLFKCNICSLPRRQAPKTGYSNLLGHLTIKYPTHGQEFAEFQRRKLSSLDVFGFVDPGTCNMYDWVRWIVDRNLPLSEVEADVTRQVVKMRPTSVETVKMYMRRIAKSVGNTISRAIGETFGLMFDGWSAGTQHYMYAVVFAVYHAENGHQEWLIGLRPMEDGFTTAAHMDHLHAIMSVYGKTPSMVFLVTDNCSTNQSVASKMCIPLVGSASHRSNLFLSEFETETSQIQNLMLHLRMPLNLRGTRNATRWSSVYGMIDLARSSWGRSPSNCFAPPQAREVEKCHGQIAALAPRTGRGAKIEQAPQFENAVVKLTGCGLPSGRRSHRFPVVDNVERAEDEDFASGILQLSKSCPGMEEYDKLLLTIPATSDRCGRLFSQCKYVLSPHRSSLHSANFEMVMFMKVNREIWNAATLLP
ncbi:TPA: LOW QUALITY PROTEIN: hypothetical protein N0F65_011235 [Lagenidium giganteum]|uniref:HAT C-terminal dimerisation domain-containing protein n=1 Tax=Lagenidium giganteum TaxID=4803 RepID=A0AAV2YRZ0_9STRA|nr:TPA: LOW QUALITY PROTEIN: hypothetical protein N0F65_011235 [Lagenidium giganteum]